MSDDAGPKLPKTYYNGPDPGLAEVLGEALSSVESILRRLVRDADINQRERDQFTKALDALAMTSVYLDRNLGPG
jgi:hypothetical protein